MIYGNRVIISGENKEAARVVIEKDRDAHSKTAAPITEEALPDGRVALQWPEDVTE